jgi:dTDP-4-dehydrorhamnose 3,5-epimerase
MELSAKEGDRITFRVGKIDDVVVQPLRRLNDSRGWLCELFRRDELAAEFFPEMCYISATQPGVTRGPHEHVAQADLFCFVGPSNFKLRMWDNRPDSATYGNMWTLIINENDPHAVIIPKGIVHAYQNIGVIDGIVINCPNRLYMGAGRQDASDDIRYEDDPYTIFRMTDD